jgi:hypothetical protein
MAQVRGSSRAGMGSRRALRLRQGNPDRGTSTMRVVEQIQEGGYSNPGFGGSGQRFRQISSPSMVRPRLSPVPAQAR